MNTKTQAFDENARDYDSWFERYPEVFNSEVEALRDMLPSGESHGIEVGLGTGRFSVALGIKEGVEPAVGMRDLAVSRGIEVMDGSAEQLPYKDLKFDFVLMASCVSYFTDVDEAIKEANRVLKPGGVLILGHIVKDSPIANGYEAKRAYSTFYKQATFYATTELEKRIKSKGFRNLEFSQTLFGDLNEIKTFQPALKGYDKGCYVVIKAEKK